MADPVAGALRATFRKPFAEQVAAFRLRLGNQVPTARWDDIWQEGHERAFMVAGAVKADLLADLAGAMDRAIAEGTGFKAFKADFRGIVEKHGWHGWTGDTTDKAREWRMRVIHNTNMRTSYMAGRHAQLIAGKFRYWVYRHGGSREPRLQHLGWDGLILPPEHPFWATHYPPNGWGCSCDVYGARTLAAAKRRGGDPGHALPEGWDQPAAKTGAPPGIDRGWAYAPGAGVAGTVRAMTEKTVAWPYQLGKAYMADIPDKVLNDFVRGYLSLPSLREAVRRYADAALTRVVDPYRTLGRLSSQQVDEIARVSMDVAGYDFTIDRSAVRHIATGHMEVSEALRGQRPVTSADIAGLASLLDGAAQIDAAGSSHATGHPLVRFTIRHQGETWVAVFELRKRRRMLALATLYIAAGR